MTLEELNTVNGLIIELRDARWLVSHTLQEGNTAANLMEAYVVTYGNKHKLALFPEELDAIRRRREEHVEELVLQLNGLGVLDT